ncbi:MAG: hypothetical protein ACK4K9_02245 [Bacteroidia bacterium]
MYKSLNFLFAFFIAIAACKKTGNPNNENEHDAITTVQLIFKTDTLPPDTFFYDDPDGDGGNYPLTIDTIKLTSKKIYNVEVRFLNKTKNPAVDVTQIVIEQATAHEVFYLPLGLNLLIEKTDKDKAGFPLGLKSIWSTATPLQKGQIRIKLMHKPVVKGANDSPNIGHTDVDIYMPIIVE